MEEVMPEHPLSNALRHAGHAVFKNAIENLPKVLHILGLVLVVSTMQGLQEQVHILGLP